MAKQPATAAPPKPPERNLVPLQQATPPPAALVATTLPEGAAAFLSETKDAREQPRSIPLVTIDHKNGLFVLPNGDCVNEVSGYPIYYFHTRKFYAKPPQPGQKGQPPDCWSADCLVPHQDSVDKQHSTCAGCPQNEFGTGRDGRSKACAMPTWIFLLNPAFGTPPLGVVAAPSSSLRNLVGTRFQQGYFARAAAKHGVYEIVWTTFRLETIGGQVIHCVLDPVMGEAIGDPAKCKQLAGLRNEFMQGMNAIRGLTPDVAVGEQEP